MKKMTKKLIFSEKRFIYKKNVILETCKIQIDTHCFFFLTNLAFQAQRRKLDFNF